jgi:hypothetical protein
MTVPSIKSDDSRCPFCGSELLKRVEGKAEYVCGSTFSKSRSGSISHDNCTFRKTSAADEPERTHLWQALFHSNDALEANCTIMQPLFALANSVADLYKDLELDARKRYGSKESDCSEILWMQTCVIARHELVFSMLALTRGRLEEALSDTRRAVEFCLFAAWVVEKPSAADKWLQALNPECWKDYKDAFKIHRILEAKNWRLLEEMLPAIKRLIEDYEDTSKRIHASVLGARPNLRWDEDILTIGISDDYGCSLEPPLLQELGSFILYSHLNVLDVLEKLHVRERKTSPAGWREEFRNLEDGVNELLRSTDNSTELTTK